MTNDNGGQQVFIEEAKILSSRYPELFFEFENDKPCLKGTIKLTDSERDVVDSYELKIFWTQGYPYKFPFVFETGERIPKNLDWHIFETDGHCCIKAIPEEMILCRKGISLEWFISTQLVPYLFNQSFRQENGYYYHERSHGIIGTIESFADIFKTNNVSSIVKLLTLLEGISEYKATAKCVCGSNKKYKKCHRKTIRSLPMMRMYNIPDMIQQIQTYKNLYRD